MKNHVKTYIAAMIAVTALVMGICVGALTERADRNNPYMSSSGISNNKLNNIWNIVQTHYVDPVDGDEYMDKVYSAILSTLDPHSSYLPHDLLEKENEALRGNFEGVGIILRFRNDTVCVGQAIPGGPSEKAGLVAGDRILAVDGISISGVKMNSDTVISHLRGKRRSVADLTIQPAGQEKTRIVKVTRDVISTPTVTYAGTIGDIGYICLDRFGQTSHDEFCQAVEQLKKQGMKRMILDLRGNGGGLLTAAIGICDELLPGKELIVYTEGTHSRRSEIHSTKGGLFATGDLIVMIDEYSASASEIVAGAIQDNDRGIIVGRRSFGKGLVQEQFQLSDQSAIQLTVARYYTPSGRCIQRPYDKGTDEYYNEFLQHVLDEYNGDSVLAEISDSTPYHTRNGRVVYGGGGIYPDHPIPYTQDTCLVYDNTLLRNNVMSDYVFDYVSRNGRNIKSQYPDEKIFLKQFRVNDKMMEEFFSMAEKKGIHRNTASIKRYGEEMRARTKAEIGQMLYSNSTFYAVMVAYDNEIKKAISFWK